MRQMLHDVPNQWSVSNLDHRLRNPLGVLPQSRSPAAGEYDSFHGYVYSFHITGALEGLEKVFAYGCYPK